jgi:hypothetical protein
MGTANAASPAEGYSRRFWTRLKEKIGLKSAIVDLVLASLTVFFHHTIFGEQYWGRLFLSGILAFIAFAIGHLLIKSISLLISRDKQLEVLERRVPELERNISHRKYQKLKDVQAGANFLWLTREESELWRQNRQQWMIYAVDAIADARDIDEESAKNLLFESSGMDSYDDFRILQRHMENLKKVIDSFPRSP